MKSWFIFLLDFDVFLNDCIIIWWFITSKLKLYWEWKF